MERKHCAEKNRHFLLFPKMFSEVSFQNGNKSIKLTMNGLADGAGA